MENFSSPVCAFSSALRPVVEWADNWSLAARGASDWSQKFFSLWVSAQTSTHGMVRRPYVGTKNFAEPYSWSLWYWQLALHFAEKVTQTIASFRTTKLDHLSRKAPSEFIAVIISYFNCRSIFIVTGTRDCYLVKCLLWIGMLATIFIRSLKLCGLGERSGCVKLRQTYPLVILLITFCDGWLKFFLFFSVQPDLLIIQHCFDSLS